MKHNGQCPYRKERGSQLKIRKKHLLLLAGLVWMAAGANILRIGIVPYTGYLTLLNGGLSAAVFCFFWFMIFSRMVRKHTIRITGYQEEKQFFLKFFDRKSFIIMACMMTMGIGLRATGICPPVFIAVFYTGLGAALTLAGVRFAYTYIQHLRTPAAEREPEP